VSVVAIVPAKDSAGSVGATVGALWRTADQVVVVDDGSSDDTAARAEDAGARVVRLAKNVGKGGAVAAGVAAAPEADVYLLIDADVGDTAGAASVLLAPVLSGAADMTVGVLPAAGSKGGFGRVRELARRGIKRACGFEARAPLSGQRAVRGELLRSLALADRFGLEVGLTIDAVRAGARVVEVDVAMDHRHTGRRLAGFRHRARQGGDVVRALWPRVTTARQRLTAVVALALLFTAASLVTAASAVPGSVGPSAQPDKVVVFGMPGLSWSDLGTGRLPTVDRMVGEGAVAAMSVRTAGKTPSTAEAYATLGAGSRVVGPAALADSQDAGGGVVVLGAPAALRANRHKHLPTDPGALGDALRAAGKRAAVVGNADTDTLVWRPAASAVMDRNGRVDAGEVGARLLNHRPEAPFGLAASPTELVSAAVSAMRSADVVVVDPGDLDRAARWSAVAPPPSASAASAARRTALTSTDEVLGRLLAATPPRTLVLLMSVVPRGAEWRTTPVVAWGAGVRHGYLHSPSVRRVGVVTLTDLAPTILASVSAAVPDAMIGHPLRYRPGPVNLDALRRLDRDAAFRERLYFPVTLAYIIFQALIYLLAMVVIGRGGSAVSRRGRVTTLLRWVVLAIAAWPLATFVLRAIPNAAAVPGLAVPLLVGVSAVVALVASRARRHPLSALSWILGLTVALLLVDVATGARLQTSSILGYSLHTAARFTGLGNTAFAVLAASAVLWGVAHLSYAPRPREALWAVAAVFALVIVFDGAPSLGDDIGGILTLVPVLGLALIALSGRRVRLRTVVVAGLVTVLVLGAATGVELLRPAGSRTHVGQLATNVEHHGSGSLTTTVERKLQTNLRTYKSVWLWLIVVIAVYLLFFFAWGHGWTWLVPRGSPLRIGVVATLAVGLLGNALNDSGAVVTALVFVYLGPFLTLLALDRRQPA
jgi:hypothetical protein